MARIFLTAGETAGVLGNSPSAVFGTSAAETVWISADARIVFDASFNKGGDVINIAGLASDYTAHLSGSTLVLTAANGANIVIPVGVEGAMLRFLDSDARALSFSPLANKVFLGDATVPADGSTLSLAASSLGGHPADADSPNQNNNVVDGGAGNDRIALSSNANSIEQVRAGNNFGSDRVLNFAAGKQVLVAPATAEQQTISFAVDDAIVGTAQAITVIVHIDDGTASGYDVPVDIMAGASAGGISDAVAAALADKPGIDTVSSDGAGVVELVYDIALGDVAQATCEIVAEEMAFARQVAISGIQADAATVTLDFAGETFVVEVAAGSTPEQIEQVLVTQIQNSGSADVAASIVAGADGSFEIYFYGAGDPGSATVVVDSVGGAPDASYSVTELAPVLLDQGVDCSEATARQGGLDKFGYPGFDIIDLSEVMHIPAPEYFWNTMQADGAEPAAIDALIDSGLSGVILIDKVDADPTLSELQEIQAIVMTADDTAQTGMDLSVIIAVDSTFNDLNGVYGDFYLVNDGIAAGDSTASYLGRMYLGGSDLPGKEDIGNFDMLTIKNFTPLTPSEIIDSYGSII